MSVRIRVAVMVVAILLSAPGLAAAVCFSVTGLPAPVGFDLSPLAPSLRGHAPVVGEAQGVCGPGEPPALLEGTATLDQGGAARIGFKLLAARPGCSGGEAEVVLPPPFSTGTGQVRLPEGSVANVRLAVDASGDACRLGTPRPGACVANSTTLCLQQNRFRVTASLPPASPNGGPVTGLVFRHTSESGHAGSDAGNVEVTIKILNACGVNNRYWVSQAPLSDVQYVLTVTDTQTGQVKTYTNPQGRAGLTSVDTAAFATCP